MPPKKQQRVFSKLNKIERLSVYIWFCQVILSIVMVVT
jgi:hypothetical protein